MNREPLSTELSYHVRITASLRERRSAISAACDICVASKIFIFSAKATRDALSEGSGIGLSFIAVREERVDGKADAEARTMARMASEDSCDGGSEAGGAWKKSGWDLSAVH